MYVELGIGLVSSLFYEFTCVGYERTICSLRLWLKKLHKFSSKIICKNSKNYVVDI